MLYTLEKLPMPFINSSKNKGLGCVLSLFLVFIMAYNVVGQEIRKLRYTLETRVTGKGMFNRLGDTYELINYNSASVLQTQLAVAYQQSIKNEDFSWSVGMGIQSIYGAGKYTFSPGDSIYDGSQFAMAPEANKAARVQRFTGLWALPQLGLSYRKRLNPYGRPQYLKLNLRAAYALPLWAHAELDYLSDGAKTGGLNRLNGGRKDYLATEVLLEYILAWKDNWSIGVGGQYVRSFEVFSDYIDLWQTYSVGLSLSLYHEL